ncbi:MAG TPA: SDR family oxidoreductase [Gemmatimonadaceae bacterium]|nr:SDR family oxidoreductase [Gemmatimonadaceae bacterium]
MNEFTPDEWALILGGSSGFGLATAKAVARRGMSVCIIHRDRRGAMPRIDADFAEIRSHGGRFLSLNIDALSADGRKTALDSLAEATALGGKVRMLLHSIALGNLKPVAPVPEAVKSETDYGEALIDDEDMARTIYSMGTSLLSWVQDVFARKLFAGDARVFGLTSEGNQVAWRGYAAVSAAKAALEAVSRSIAVEFAPYGIRSNIIQPGVTDTPALRVIPGNDRMREVAERRNPYGRLTRPEDVAEVIALLCRPEAAWVNGAIIPVDGGERIAPA